jgi:hypothetical protein
MKNANRSLVFTGLRSTTVRHGLRRRRVALEHDCHCWWERASHLGEFGTRRELYQRRVYQRDGVCSGHQHLPNERKLHHHLQRPVVQQQHDGDTSLSGRKILLLPVHHS